MLVSKVLIDDQTSATDSRARHLKNRDEKRCEECCNFLDEWTTLSWPGMELRRPCHYEGASGDYCMLSCMYAMAKEPCGVTEWLSYHQQLIEQLHTDHCAKCFNMSLALLAI